MIDSSVNDLMHSHFYKYFYAIIKQCCLNRNKSINKKSDVIK